MEDGNDLSHRLQLKGGDFWLLFRTNENTGVKIGYKERRSEYEGKCDCHDFWELLYVDRGTVNLNVDDYSFVIPQGTFFLIMPGQYHALHSHRSTPLFYATVHFETDISNLSYLGNRVISIDEDDRRLIISLLTENENKELGSEVLMHCYFAEFLLKVVRGSQKNSTAKSLPSYFQENLQKKIIDNALSFMASNIDSSICLRDIARSVGVSQSHLEHIFKRYTGKSVMFQLQDLRIQRAKELLLASQFNISEIATLCGYSSIHLFSRRFKKIVAITPSEYSRMVGASLNACILQQKS